MGGKESWKIIDYDRLSIRYALLLVVILPYPFRFQLPIRSEANHAVWLSEENGVEFTPVSEIRSETPNDNLNNELISGDGFAIEVWMATDDYQRKGPARIVSYSFDLFLRNFTLGQEGNDLIVRLRTEETDLNGFPETTFKNVFLSDDPYHIVVTYDYHMERIYVNGRKLAEETLISGGSRIGIRRIPLFSATRIPGTGHGMGASSLWRSINGCYPRRRS
jgi:hypothetical protein